VWQGLADNDIICTGGALTPTAVRELLERQSVLLRLTVHELRRPQVVVNGWLSMILDGSLGTPAAPDHLDRAFAAMASAVREMALLTDGLAAVAEQDDGLADVLRRRPCRLQSVIAEAIAAVEPDARAREVGVEVRGADAAATVDPDRIRTALVNLLGNAVRHSPQGGTVRVDVQAAGDTVTMAVSDEGPGVPPEIAGRIFEPWCRGATDSGGFGLGLWIVRRIVEWHGGRVTVQSAPGLGATFRVELPRSRHGLTVPGPN
jgi:signal transduction histidine kinase